MGALACPALKGLCQLRGIVRSLSQGPRVTQSPRTGPAPWPTLWVRAPRVRVGERHWTAPRFKFIPLITFLQPRSSLRRWLASPPLYRGEKRVHSDFPSPALHPQLLALCTPCHMKCVFQGSSGDGSYGYRGRGRAAPGPAKRPGTGSLDSKPPSNMTAAHPPPLSIPGRPGQRGRACVCLQIHPLGVWSGGFQIVPVVKSPLPVQET